jgi:threonine aldolase
MKVDLRSDTVTKPCQPMREAIANAEVDDDVIGIDPTVAKLQEVTAELLGKEAAIFVPSGSMSNQIALRLHCRPGEEFLCEAGCHVYNYEQAAFAQLSGLVAKTIHGEDHLLSLEQLQDQIRPENEHLVRTRLVCLENTHNRGAGRIHPLEQVVSICKWAHENDLKTHLDGARLFNAAVASGVSLREWSEHFDSVSVCFSKGLGAPVGSVLAGTADFIYEARRARKLFGGGMRQAGILAAAALFALDNNYERLAEDHVHAQMLADAIRKADGVRLTPDQVDTNIVIFEVAKELATAAQFVERLEEQGVRSYAFGPQQVRLVTHLDVDREQAEYAAKTLIAVTKVAGTLRVPTAK